MNEPRIAMIGLGRIAQKAYLPILSAQTSWQLVGAFTPNQDKRGTLCAKYRINEFSSIADAAKHADAVFVHCATKAHYQVVAELLQLGKDVYVDKPLAATTSEAEELVNLSVRYGRKLMVGFNRRFAPYYVQLKEQLENVADIRIEKHRMNKIGPNNFEFTLGDDYLHLIDTARWFANGELKHIHGAININNNRELHFIKDTFSAKNFTVTTFMHRSAGTNREEICATTDQQTITVKNLHQMVIERGNQIIQRMPEPWETMLKQRGFEDSVAHFIDCVTNNKKPIIDGYEALQSQQLLQGLIARMVHF